MSRKDPYSSDKYPREKIKRASYLIRYCSSVETVSSQTEISKEDAKEMVEKFNEQYPNVRKILCNE